MAEGGFTADHFTDEKQLVHMIKHGRMGVPVSIVEGSQFHRFRATTGFLKNFPEKNLGFLLKKQ
jgi:hypothetical protein